MEQACYYLNKLEILINNITKAVPEFSHIDTGKILFSLKSSPKNSDNGYYAEVKCLSNTPFDFISDGRITKHYYSDCLFKNGIPALYLIVFTVPCFVDLNLREKICTIMHELYHISPLFNGELRLFNGKNCLHGPQPEKFDEYMYYLADIFLSKYKSLDKLFSLDYEKLNEKHGSIQVKSTRQSRKYIYRLTWA